ncbi:MAG: penicillin acylase family protein [Acidobacteriota bacterium]
MRGISSWSVLVLWTVAVSNMGGFLRAAGELEFQPGDFPDLLAPVRVVWDVDEVPHVFAGNDHDAYFAMGYLHARDRLFQMDYNRHLFSGTLAELVGTSALDSDIQLRTLGLRRAAERSLAIYSEGSRTLFDAYSAGINAYIQQAGPNLPAEYQSLELTSVEPWTSLDSVTVASGVAFGLSFDLFDIQLTQDRDAFVEAGQKQGFDGEALFSDDLDRSAPFDPTVTIPPSQAEAEAGDRAKRPAESLRKISPELLDRYLEKVRRNPFLKTALERKGRSSGSNFWIIGPAHSATGHALFANDPHLSLNMPAVFYEIQLSVFDDPANGSMNVSGVSFPGTPGVVQGCNDQVCWGSTVNPMDVTDVYQEQLIIGLDSSLQAVVQGTYFDGKLEPVVKIPQTYRVNQVGDGVDDNLDAATVGPLAGGITYVVPRRNNGPIVQVIQNPQNSLDVKALSIQYTGWGATRVGETFLHLARARNLQQFRDTLQYFDFGSQNWGYADVDGNIAYFTSGELPIREDLQAGAVDGSPPWFVRDGTHQAHNEWLAVEHPQPLQALGFEILPYDEMPQIINPAQGYIANANNDPIGVSLDNDVLNQFRPDGGILYLNPGFTSLRIGRIGQMIHERFTSEPGGLSLDDLQAMQADNQLLDAQVFVPYILTAAERGRSSEADPALAALMADPGVSEAVERFVAWNFTTPTGIQAGYDPGDDPLALPQPSQSEIDRSIAATIYAVWRSRFVQNTIDATLARVDLGPYHPDDERSLSALRNFLDHFDEHHGVGVSGLNFFEVDGVSSPGDARDILILRSLQEALTALGSNDFQAAFGNSVDQNDYRWGRLHRIVFDHPLGDSYDLPPSGGFSDLSASLPGLSRSGGYETVDAASHSVRASDSNGFMFGSGPARRFVADLDPTGIRAFQVIPGGRSGDRTDASYASEMDLWLTNQYHPLRLNAVEVEAHQDREAWLTPPAYHFYFPSLQDDAANFTAFAVANMGGQPVELDFQGWGADGTLSNFPDNPHVQELPGGRQFAELASEIFSVDSSSAPQSGWVELTARLDSDLTDWPFLGSFTQAGDFRLTELDGAAPLLVPARELFFTMLDPQADESLSLANPGNQPVTVRLELFLDQPAATLAGAPTETTQRTIPAHGVLFETVAALFSTPINSPGYIRVLADDGSGLVGVEWIHSMGPGTLRALNAQPAGGAATSYSAQLAFGPGLETQLNLVNVGDLDRRVVVRVVRGSTTPDIASAPILLHPGEFQRVVASELFSEQPVPEAGFLVGSLVVDSDGLGVIGSVGFGDSQGKRFGTALPLQNTPFRKAVFGHVANLGGFFTGLALFNPGHAEAAVRIRVFDSQGELIGEAVHTLAPQGRISEPLSTLVPSLGEMSGGYIVIDSDQPVVGQEIFGTSDLRLQSAVPPTLLK